MSFKKGFTRTPKFGVTPKGDGFSLIELLIVVVIVGILTGIILSYISENKIKGSDASVKSNLATIRSVAEIFYSDNGNSYLPTGGELLNISSCPAYNTEGTNMFSKNKIIADAIKEATFNGNNGVCYNSVNKWAIAVGLKSSVETSWCVDSSGAGRIVKSDAGGAINPITFNCN